MLHSVKKNNPEKNGHRPVFFIQIFKGGKKMTQDDFKGLFGKRFKQALIEKDFKHIEFSELTGISAKQISMYATGNALPTVYGLRLIVDALGISSDFLLGVSNKIIPS